MPDTFNIRTAKIYTAASIEKYLSPVILARSEAFSVLSGKASDASETMKGLARGVPDVAGIPAVCALIVSDATEKTSDTSNKVLALSDKASERAAIVQEKENTQLVTSKNIRNEQSNL